MTFEEALRARVRADVATMAIAKSAEWVVRPQGKALPAIVFQIVSDPRGLTMTGADGWRPTRVQVDVLALTGPAKVALRDALLALLGTAATIGGVRMGRLLDVSVRDLSEQAENDFVHRDMIDAVIWHN